MTSNNLLAFASDWQQQADECLLTGNYVQATRLYEQAIAAESNVKSYYWHLGLMLLLQGQEVEAQTTWLWGMADSNPEEMELWTNQLVQVLETEAERQRLQLADYSVAWAIRQHIREINPTDINNLLHLVGLSMALQIYTGEELKALGVLEILKSKPSEAVDSEVLLQVWKSVLDYAPLHSSSLEFTEAILDYVKEPILVINNLISFVYRLAYLGKQTRLAASFTELALRLDPTNPELLRTITSFYQDIHEYSKGIEFAKLCFSVMQNLADKAFANHLLIRGLMGAGGYWEESCTAFEFQKSLLASIVEEQPTNLEPSTATRLFNSMFFFPYFQDMPQENLQIRRQVAQVCQLNIENYNQEQVEKLRQWRSPVIKIDAGVKRLKIGYLSHCLRNHSVGWLARGLFQHYDRERFEVYAYLLGSDPHLRYDPLQKWYVNQVSQARNLELNTVEAAEKIHEDEIDILIELDSLTLNTTCEIMTMKPAPVQVTWLGWDAAGISSIDYYIADPYVLPEYAQSYYEETIWRLPQTYIAVSGFEVGVPSIRREDLNIPTDAVIYLSTQRGWKYNPVTARLQMQIIKAIPNSYFLVKGLVGQESLKNFLIEIAETEGLSRDCLRFLSLDSSESEHRANLGIADVVLDTYPYNGATTTMETLWMGVPLVTRVGEQFSARNSYTMMMNAGISEGIAWTDEEYVEWGIRLGKDPVLRQQISWKLRQSRQTAPLWNAKQFTREMEKAYEQMWQIYVDRSNH
jgi:predicted O-linked N-acetylglucosamine transferase (SPINDLY family)